MNKLFVYLVKSLAPVWRRLGADPKALALILDAKLKMDDRGGYVMGQQQAPKSGMEFLVFVFMFFFGCISVVAFFLVDYTPDAVGLVFCFWLVYIGLLLVTELSKNLFDTRDLYILLTRPITDATLNLARTLHIGVFTSKVALCMGLPVFLFMAFYYGPWSAITFFLTSICVVIITLVATLGVYLLLFRYAPAHKVRRWVGYLQIFMGSFFFILYQLPSLADIGGADGEFMLPQLVDRGWGYLFPGLWVGGLWGTLNGLVSSTHGFVQAGIALVATAGGFAFYVRNSGGYGQQLLDMDRAGSAPEAALENAKTKHNSWFAPRRWVGEWFTKPGLERASLNFHWRMMQRDMDFKQRTYPSMVIFPILVLSFVGKSLFGDKAESVGSLPYADDRWIVVLILYMLVMAVMAPLANTKASKSYKASWIFMATPLAKPGPIQYGQLLAILSTFLLPIALFTYGFVLFRWGSPVILDIVLAAGVGILITIILVQMDKDPPFSKSIDNANGDSFGTILIGFFLLPLFGFGHYFASKLLWLAEAATILVWLLNIYLLRQLRRG